IAIWETSVIVSVCPAAQSPTATCTVPAAPGAATIRGTLIGATVGGSVVPSCALKTWSAIRVPRIVAAPGAAGTVQVAVGDWAAGQTDTITDVSQMAIRQQEALHPYILARAITRRAVKKGTIYGVKQGLGMRDGLPSLALDVAGIAWEASERADTRCWSLLPDRIQVLRLELPVGSHVLQLRPLDRHGQPLGQPVEQSVQVADGRNTYLLVQATDTGLVGQPLTNSR
ncbi:MAG: hypothetical protein ACKOHG_03445, partial [Planctomycetia bacterium]